MSGGTREVETVAGPSAGASRGRWTWIIGTLLVAAVLMFCYLRIAGTTQVNSDGAGLVLEASSILHGNVLLHGWWATDVSFYTTELPEYVLVTAFAGVRPEVVHICSALTYTLLVLLAAFVARGRARGPAGVIRALLAAGIVLAPQPTGPTQVLLGSPDHLGTAVPVLVLLLLLEWAPPRWYGPAGAGLLLAASIVGDPLIEVVGVAPLFLGCLIRAVRILRQRRADASAPAASSRRPSRLLAWAWRTARYEWSLAAAAALAVPAAWLARLLLEYLGGYDTAKAVYGLQPPREILHGGPIVARSVLALFGADFESVTGAGNIAFALAHLIGVAVVLAAVLLAAWRLIRPGTGAGDPVSDFIVIAVAANFAAFFLEVPQENIYSAHEIGPLLSLGAALAGRALGGMVAARLGHGAQPEDVPAAPGPPLRSRPRRILLGACVAGLACYALMLGIAAAHKQLPPRNIGLTQWLAGRHLTSGIAPYWEASSITVDSGGSITMIAVKPEPGTKYLEPQHWQTEVLLAGQGHTADFVITSPAEDVHRKYVLATFGRPAVTYRYGPYTIMVWPKNLLPYLDTRPAAVTSRRAARR